MKFSTIIEYRELDVLTSRVRVDNFPRDTTLQSLQEIRTTMEENRIQPELFEDRIIFMSTCNDIDWGKARNEETCMSNSSEAAQKISHRTLVIPRIRN